MTGSAINISSKNILPGMPLSEDEQGNVLPADASQTAFAVATDGGPSGTIITYADSGVVERSDWMPVFGTRKLTAGRKYFLGTQQIGVGRSATQLRISIQQLAAKVSNIWPLTAPPSKGLGAVADFALDQNTLAFYLKQEAGWGLLGFLVKTAAANLSYAPITVFNEGNGWSFTPSS